MDTVPEDMERRTPRHDLASRVQTAVGSDAALSFDPPRVGATGGSFPENQPTALALR
jgi:hypothetical protein